MRHLFSSAIVALVLVAAAPAHAAPKPEDIVNIVLSDHPTGGGDARRVVYNVPADHWLIITDAAPVATGGGGSLYVFSREGTKDTAKLVVTERGYSSVTGLAFPPGSKVVVIDSGWAAANFTGYLVAP